MKELGETIKKFFNISRSIPVMPMLLLVAVADILNKLGKLFNKFQDIHPVRVKKAGFPPNIKPQFLIDHNFEFKYPFEKSLEHWTEISPEDFNT